MLHLEFAISPLAIENLSDLTIIDSLFGYEKGALISQFPRSWFRETFEKLQIQDEIKKSKAEEKLRMIKDQCLISFSRQYNGVDWIEAVENSHLENKFHRIVAPSGTPSTIRKLNLNDLEKDDFSFSTEYQRDAESLANAAKALLINSEKVTLFDPYISPINPGSINILNRLMSCCIKSDVEFHVFSDEEKMPSWAIRMEKLNEIKTFLPKKIKLYWYFVSDNGSGLMHKRGLFTVKGGLIYDRGFQEPRDLEQKRQFTSIMPMPLHMLEADAKLYNSASDYDNFKIVNKWCS